MKVCALISIKKFVVFTFGGVMQLHNGSRSRVVQYEIEGDQIVAKEDGKVVARGKSIKQRIVEEMALDANPSNHQSISLSVEIFFTPA